MLFVYVNSLSVDNLSFNDLPNPMKKPQYVFRPLGGISFP